MKVVEFPREESKLVDGLGMLGRELLELGVYFFILLVEELVFLSDGVLFVGNGDLLAVYFHYFPL